MNYQTKVTLDESLDKLIDFIRKNGTKKLKGRFSLIQNEAKESPNNWCWSDKNIENMNEIVNDYKLVETTTGDGKKNFCCPINDEGLSKIPYRGVCEEPIIYDEPPVGSKSSLCPGGSGNNAIGDSYCCDKNQLYDLTEMKCRTNNLGDKGKERVTKGIMKVGKLVRKSGAIAGAGGAAHLPGMIASLTTLPVLGVPIESKSLKGIDSLLSILQMPAGIPVGTLAIGSAGAKNAALLAASILSSQSTKISKNLEKWRLQQTKSVAISPIDD